MRAFAVIGEKYIYFQYTTFGEIFKYFFIKYIPLCILGMHYQGVPICHIIGIADFIPCIIYIVIFFMSDINTRDAEKIGRLETENKNLEKQLESLQKEIQELQIQKKALEEEGENKTKAVNEARKESKEKEKLHEEEIQKILETL